jgi:hypothetical protein
VLQSDVAFVAINRNSQHCLQQPEPMADSNVGGLKTGDLGAEPAGWYNE